LLRDERSAAVMAVILMPSKGQLREPADTVTDQAGTSRQEAIRSYLEFRRQHSGSNPCPSPLDYMCRLDFEHYGISSDAVRQYMLRLDYSSIDALCLELMNCLLSKDKGPASGKIGRNAVVNQTITWVLCYYAATTQYAVEPQRKVIPLPPSFLLLIRWQLCGTTPKLGRTIQERNRRESLAVKAASMFDLNERLTIRGLAERLGISKKASETLLNSGFADEVAAARATLRCPLKKF
jgi:hypothetical protein